MNEGITLYDELREKVRTVLLTPPIQPGAGELLAMLEEQYGWPVRHVFAEAVAVLRDY